MSSPALLPLRTSNEGQGANVFSNLRLRGGNKNMKINSIILVNLILYSLSKGLCCYFQQMGPRRKRRCGAMPPLRACCCTGLSWRIPQL